MKRLFTALLLAILLLSSLSGIPGLAEPKDIPHEDPATAGERQNPVLLLTFLGDILDLTSQSRYQDALELLDATRFANVADDIRYVIDRYSELSQRLVNLLDDLEKLLDETDYLLTSYLLEQAEQNLIEANSLSNDASSLLAEISLATANIADADYQLVQAYDRLEDILKRIDQLIGRLNQTVINLGDRYTSQSQVVLRETEITLTANPPTIFIGGQLTASGRLTSGGNPLADRTVAINLDGNSYTTITDEDGSFKAHIAIPYRYVPTMNVRASYSPAGEDIGVYSYSRSLPVTINTLFYTTTLEVSAPDSSRPGLPLVIEGRLHSQVSSQERSIRIFLDDRLIHNGSINGSFGINLVVPDDIADGNHSISFIVAPQGLFSSARQDLPITIARLPVTLDLEMPSIVLLPGSIEVSGCVRSLGEPVANARINITFRDEQIDIVTDNLGYFSAEIGTTLDLSLIGPQQISFQVSPAEPYYASLTLKEWLFTINTANIGFMVVVVISLGVITYTRLRTKPAARPATLVSLESDKPEQLSREPLPVPKSSLSAARNEAYSIYLKSLRLVEQATKTTMLPDTTLREYAAEVKPLLRKVYLSFDRLTRVAEMALYSPVEPGKSLTMEAFKLAATIEKEISYETA